MTVTPLSTRVRNLEAFLGKFVPVPNEWLEEDAGVDGGLNPVFCDNYDTLVNAWRKSLKWTDGLDVALSVMLASVTSTKSVGEQLWIKIIGPPSCLHGDTPIYDPTDNTTKTVRERWEEKSCFHVYSRTEEGCVVIAEAYPPVQKEKAQIYDVTFESGKVLKVTAGHQFWNGVSYVALHTISDELLSSDAYQLPTISAHDLLAHISGVPRLIGIPSGYLDGCSRDLHQCDEQLQLEEGNGPISLTGAIVSVKPCVVDNYYDFHVPVQNNYWAEGVFHHNSGKTTLLEGLAVNRKFVLSKSTIRGFHSGYKTPDGEDHSLIVQVRDKTLATKDGDTLLKAPNLREILAEARDIYDMTSRTHYRNSMSNDYSGIRMTWILCGTAALREIDESELGARFIDCVIMEDIDEDFEDDVNWRAANQENNNMALESDGDSTNQYSPALVEAMQLTGGYVEYLRNNAQNLLKNVSMSEAALRRCTILGKFIAFMRARPSKSARDDNGSREFSPRLVKLMVRVSKCMAVVLNKNEVDDEVMLRVTKVAMDTSRGQSLKIIEHLAKAEHGMERKGLATLMNRTEPKISELLRFLKQIGAVTVGEVQKKLKWSLSERMKQLYQHVEGD